MVERGAHNTFVVSSILTTPTKGDIMIDKIKKHLERKGYSLSYGLRKAGVSGSTTDAICNGYKNMLPSTLEDAWQKVKELDKRS